MTDIYSMKMHERLLMGSGVEILRVPGGWVYITDTGAPAFVPFVPKETDEQKLQPYLRIAEELGRARGRLSNAVRGLVENDVPYGRVERVREVVLPIDAALAIIDELDEAERARKG